MFGSVNPAHPLFSSPVWDLPACVVLPAKPVLLAIGRDDLAAPSGARHREQIGKPEMPTPGGGQDSSLAKPRFGAGQVCQGVGAAYQLRHRRMGLWVYLKERLHSLFSPLSLGPSIAHKRHIVNLSSPKAHRRSLAGELQQRGSHEKGQDQTPTTLITTLVAQTPPALLPGRRRSLPG